MKILIGNSPWSKPGFYGVRAGSRWPHFEKCGAQYIPFPFFLAYATALLEKNGFDVKLVDGIAEGISEEEFYRKLKDYSPDLVVYEVSTPSIELDLQVARETKKLFGKDVPVLFCGAHHEMYGTEFLKKHSDIDLVIQGEYEFTLLELAKILSSGGQLDDVKGLIYRSENGDIKLNPKRPLEMDLQKYPWPARHHLPMDKYVDLPGGIPAPSLQIWASRGCPYQCIFCSWPQIMYYGSSYRVRDPKDVVDEIEWCVKKYGFKSFYFDDDTFNIGKQRILTICEEIKNRKLSLPWAIMARADCMDREMLIALKEAGLTALKYGVESGVQEIVNVSGKNLDLAKVRKSVRMTKELGIRVHLTFTFGLPGETWDTINKTINLATELDPDSLQFSIVTPFPGSKYFDMLDRKGFILSKNWEEYDGYNRAVIRTQNLTTGDLEKALIKANRKWKRHVFFKNLRKEPFGTIKFMLSNPVKCATAYYK
jgi:radical SAM superfamily enzyme YgiQ (UPF0313 family)